MDSNALNTEFMYYGSVLKVISPVMARQVDKHLASKWIEKLFGPAYQTTKLKEKRNRYLVGLTLTILADEMLGVFASIPPEDTLLEFEQFTPEMVPAAEWETDKMWQEILEGLPAHFVPLNCSVHTDPNDCRIDHKLDTMLDQEFQLLLYIARPYATLLHPSSRTTCSAWFQTLATIHGNSCSSMRAIRNDYIMALLGYLNDLRVVGPFARIPPTETLQSLPEVVQTSLPRNPITDPTSPEVEEFLMEQPIPDDGAFCYLALTGDLLAGNLDSNM